MRYFDYRTKNHESGKAYKGIITADDMTGAVDALKRRGEDIIEIDDMKDLFHIREKLYNMQSRVKKKVKLEFFTMLGFMLESGMSLHESLVSIRDSSINKGLRALSRALADEVRKGAGLSAAMRQCGQFENAVAEQVRAGEESGNMLNTLKRIVIQLEREIDFKNKIKSAMMYPVIICVVMVVVLWVLMTVVVPSLSATLVSMGGELPLITKIVMGVSDTMAKSTPYIIVVVIAAVIVFRVMMKKPEFKKAVDTYKLKIPVVGIMLEKIELSRFCRNLSAMQQSGITLVSSLKITCAAIKNQKIAGAVSKSARLVEISGMNLAAAMIKAGSFPAMMLQLIEVGINSGKICDTLDNIANQYEKEVDTLLKRVTGLIEPVMIVVVGILAGTVVISIFLPMFELTDNLGV